MLKVNNIPITFVIVTWNNEMEIENCLKTINNYTIIDHEIIVVDNNSSDNTVKIIQTNFPEVKLIINKENLGFARGNNLALEFVTTDFVCFINPDVILTEDIINPAINVLSSNHKIGLVSSRLRNVDGSVQPSCFCFTNSKSIFCEILHIGRIMPKFIQKKISPNYYNALENYSPQWVIGAEMVMRTLDAKIVGGFSDEYYMYTEDMDLCKKIQVQLGKSVYYLTSNSLIHLGGASEAKNISYDKQKKIFQNNLVFVKKFYGKKEEEKTRRSMFFAYVIRYILLKLGYYGLDRKAQIGKTINVIRILKEI